MIRFDSKTVVVLDAWFARVVSVALALTLDPQLNQNLFLSATYYVVVFLLPCRILVLEAS
jgi:hypothetical protein